MVAPNANRRGGNTLSRRRPTGARCDPDGARPALLSCREPSSVPSPRRTGRRRQEVWDSIVGSRGRALVNDQGALTGPFNAFVHAPCRRERHRGRRERHRDGTTRPAKIICEGVRRSFHRGRPRERRSGMRPQTVRHPALIAQRTEHLATDRRRSLLC